MADKKISQLPASTTPLAGTEELALVQSGDTKKVSVNNLTSGLSISPDSVSANDISASTNFSAGGDTKVYLEIAGDNARWYVQAGFSTKNSEIRFTNNSDANVAGIDYDHIPETMRLYTASGAGVTINNSGNLVMDSGAGIDFSADGQAAGMTSELLDDYEEGTFTPVFADASSGGNAAAGGTFKGQYTKIGRNVYVACSAINIDTTGMTAGNGVFVQGLPFTAGALASEAQVWSGVVAVSSIGGAVPYSSEVGDGNAYASLRKEGKNSLLVSDLTSGSTDLYLSFWYQT